ncbi:hypothetical protein [Mycobacteroides chelonae]|uniref:hypothetical protein n=1 Tax=Mycobacteroides chelonae TaxID=1774 RepID=UPI00091C6817|nr:hypothetical protein [Mycobacteroides chelonae]OHU48763.1 hypothetical protein BKG81_15145 [Mycobacteroides chelonae]
MGTIEFNAGPARASAGLWNEAALNARKIHDAAQQIKDEPWGDDEIGRAFREKFVAGRDVFVENAKGESDREASVVPVLNHATTALSQQSRQL